MFFSQCVNFAFAVYAAHLPTWSNFRLHEVRVCFLANFLFCASCHARHISPTQKMWIQRTWQCRHFVRRFQLLSGGLVDRTVLIGCDCSLGFSVSSLMGGHVKLWVVSFVQTDEKGTSLFGAGDDLCGFVAAPLRWERRSWLHGGHEAKVSWACSDMTVRISREIFHFVLSAIIFPFQHYAPRAVGWRETSALWQGDCTRHFWTGECLELHGLCARVGSDNKRMVLIEQGDRARASVTGNQRIADTTLSPEPALLSKRQWGRNQIRYVGISIRSFWHRCWDEHTVNMRNR